MSNEKNKALDLAIAQIEKQFGKGTIMKFNERPQTDVKAIPTGSISLDIAIGVGGIPRGRIIELFGPESSGKTTLAQHIVAEVQKAGGNAAFIDAEHALDPEYARKIGVDINNMLISQPDSGEQALDIVETLVRSGALDVIVIDSVAALVPRAEIEGEMGDSHMGLQARLMSQALRKLTAVSSRANTTVIFINQLREKIGVMFGSPETTPGGRALKFYASLRLDIRRIETIKVGQDAVGNRVKVKVVKNKVAPPFGSASFDIMFGEGISREGDLIDLGSEHEIVEKSGSWFSFNGQRIGQGREAVKAYLKENPEIARAIETKIREKFLPTTTAAVPVVAAEGGENGNGKNPEPVQPGRASRRE
jgi:recombination protein RecA